MILSVTQLNSYIKEYLAANPMLNNLFVKGELSNFKLHTSGHCYMSLKDEGGVVKAVMFKFAASKLKFRPENGMKVIVNARVSAYERDGIYQLYINEMQPDGVGALHIQFEQLKEKLTQEGLFDPKFKRQIPKIPKKIGIITSPTGAAVRDIINVIQRRFPHVDVLIYPALVQGVEASASIVKGLKYFEENDRVDVIILGRGGGSIEDLWCFNEESVARCIFSLTIPVISAVGHETDFTISDFVADLRAPTPSAAAELSVPSVTELIQYLSTANHRLLTALTSNIKRNKLKLDTLKNTRVFKYPNQLLDNKVQILSDLSMKLNNLYSVNLSKKRELFIKNISKLDSLSPLKVLKRGYTFVENSKGDLVDSISKVEINDQLLLKFADGDGLVQLIKKEEKHERIL